jgi:hypothetical protein
MNYQEARNRRAELIKIIAEAADEIQRIDHQLPILYSPGLEQDLIQAEERALTI